LRRELNAGAVVFDRRILYQLPNVVSRVERDPNREQLRNAKSGAALSSRVLHRACFPVLRNADLRIGEVELPVADE